MSKIKQKHHLLKYIKRNFTVRFIFILGNSVVALFSYFVSFRFVMMSFSAYFYIYLLPFSHFHIDRPPNSPIQYYNDNAETMLFVGSHCKSVLVLQQNTAQNAGHTIVCMCVNTSSRSSHHEQLAAIAVDIHNASVYAFCFSHFYYN